MKKLVSFILLLINIGVAYAQNMPVTTRVINGITVTSANDIMENVSRLKELSTFIHWVDTAGIIQTFKANGPITVFVPNNQAFAKLNPAIIDTLLKHANKQELTKLLLTHVICGKITSKDIASLIKQNNNGQATFITLAGTKLTATIDTNRNIILTDSKGEQSIVSLFDFQQKNGILDIVTSVLMPSPN